MIHLVCWAVPVRGGYVLRADSTARSALRAACARSPHLTGWELVIVHPGHPAFSASHMQREAVLAIECSAHQPPTPRDEQTPHLSRLKHSWRTLLLGALLIVISGAHWTPALAGAWLLAGRSWLSSLIGIRSPRAFAGTWTQPHVRVTGEAHAGLTRLGELVTNDLGKQIAYAPTIGLAHTLGLKDAATVYQALAAWKEAGTVPVQDGVWVPETQAHNPTRPADNLPWQTTARITIQTLEAPSKPNAEASSGLVDRAP